MADESLSVAITADDLGASEAFLRIVSRVDQLEASFKTMSGNADTAAAVVSEGAAKMSAGMEKATESTVGFVEATKMASQHTATLARGLGAVGLEAEATAARVEGLVGALEGMQKAVPELLAVGAAIIAIGSAFEFFKSGIELSTELQSSMTTLQTAVEAQGGSWENLSEKIRTFIENESLASGFTQNELASALNDLVQRGMDAAQAMSALSVAEEVAIDTHSHLKDIVEALIGAEAGRAQALARLDPELRKIITSHGDLAQVLAILHERHKHAIDDDNTLEGAERRKKAALDAAAMSLSQSMLPVLTAFDTAMVGVVRTASSFGTGISEVFNGLIGAAQAFAHVVADLADGLNKFFHKDFGGATGSLFRAMQDGKAQVGGLREAIDGLNKSMSAFSQWGNPVALFSAGSAAIGDAKNAHDANAPDYAHIGLGSGKGKGGKGGGTGGTGFVPDAVVDQQALQKAVVDTANALQVEKDAQAALASTINQSATSVTLATAAEEKRANAAAAARHELASLLPQMDAERTALQSSVTVVNNYAAAEQSARQHLQELERAHSTNKQAVQAAKLAVQEAHQAYTEADKSLKQMTASLAAHEAEAKKDTAAVQANNDAQQKMIASYNDAIQKANEAYQNDRETHGLSLEEQIAYYREKLAIAHQKDQEFFNDHHEWNEALHKDDAAAYAKLLQLETEAYNKSYDQQKQAHDKAVKDTASFLDDLIVKHKSFKDIFKSIWDDIVKIFIDDVAKMLVESKLFGAIFGSFTGGGGGGGALNWSGVDLAGLASGGFGGAGGASGVATALTPAGTGAVVHIGGIEQSLLGSSATGTGGGGLLVNAGGGLTALGGLGLAAGAIGIGSMIGGMEGAGTGAQSTHAQWGALGSLAGAGAVFSGIGGMAGLSLLGPMGWGLLLGGALLGGAVGGMFGPHWGPDENHPDRSPYAAQYEQWVANYNGTTYNGDITEHPDQKYVGSNNMASQMAAWANANPNDPLAQQILALGKTGGDLAIASEHEGIDTLGDGKTIKWKDLQALSQQWEQKTGGGGAGGPLSALVITRTYPDFNIAGGGPGSPGGPSAIGQPGKSGGGGGGGNDGGGDTGGGGGRGGRGGAAQDSARIYVNLSGATIVGPGGLHEVAGQISSALQAISTGQSPGGYHNTLANRFRSLT